jgi:AhpD family alkylhydroperoxidase
VLPHGLAELVTFVTAVDVGCSWCVDFGASIWERKGLDPQILREAVAWRTSDRFDADHRAAFAYAEAVTAQPPQVDDAMVADLRARFGDAGVVELTYLIAMENLASRFNSSLGLSNQGFSSGDACALAAAAAGSAGRAAG